MNQYKIILSVVVLSIALIGCAASPSPTATPDAKATETNIAANIFATQTASVPTATSTPTNTTTPTLTNIPSATFEPSPTQTPKPANTALPRPTATARPPALQGETIKLLDGFDDPAIGKWEVTLISVRRDKTIWGYGDRNETAFGVWATFMFRVRNLGSGTDFLSRTYRDYVVMADGQATPYKYQIFNTIETKAQYFYACCDTTFSHVDPGGEKIILLPLDVPETAKTLSFNFSLGKTDLGILKNISLSVKPSFLVTNFDQIPPRGQKP